MSMYEKQLHFLQEKFKAGKLAHAYVFAGQDEHALMDCAKDLVKHIVGKELAGMVDKNAFPDLLVIKSADSESSQKNEKDMMEIDVDQIRAAQNFLALTSYYGGYKMVLVQDAERMNREAQNCFLKNLEEPRGNTLIMLLSTKPELLLETIASRCQEIVFVGSEAQKKEQKDVLGMIGADLAEKFKYVKAADLDGGRFENILTTLAGHFRKLDMVKYRKVLQQILELERQAQISNLNKKLALEVLLLEV